MKTASAILAVFVFAWSSSASAEDCEALIDQFRAGLSSRIDPAQGAAPADSTLQQAMQLFEQGYEQCRNGQQEQALATLKQAIAMLNGQ